MYNLDKLSSFFSIKALICLFVSLFLLLSFTTDQVGGGGVGKSVGEGRVVLYPLY